MKREHGLSLIELMVVVAIVSIMAGIAFPALGSMIAGNDLNTAQEDIIMALKKARGMAVSRSTIATVNVNSAARTVQLSVADNSFPAETITLRSGVSIAADAVLNFGAQGTVNAAGGNSTITLSSSAYASLPQRIINVSPTGIVNAAR